MKHNNITFLVLITISVVLLFTCQMDKPCDDDTDLPAIVSISPDNQVMVEIYMIL